MADTNNLELSEDFDQLLREELSIEPSPAFAARVRQRTDVDARRSPWWRARWIPAIGSLATVASIVFAILVPTAVRWTSAPLPPAPPGPGIVFVEPPHAVPPEPRASAIRRVALTRATTASVKSELPVVIVDGRQRAALRTLFTMMDQGRVSGDSFKGTVPVSLDPIADQLGEIVVAPLVVSAMPTGGVLHNDNER